MKTKEEESWREKLLKSKGLSINEEKTSKKQITCTKIEKLRNLATTFAR